MISKDESDGVFNFIVEGNQRPFYPVEIELGHEFDFCEATCECAYATDGHVCKHAVAAMLYLKNHLAEEGQIPLFNDMKPVKQAPEKKLNLQKLPQPIKIPAKGDDIPQPKTLLVPYRTSKGTGRWAIHHAEILTNRLEMGLKFSWQYDYFDSVKVTMRWDPGKSSYFLECSDNLDREHCEHINFLLNFVIEYEEANLLELIRADVIKIKKTRYLEEAGVKIQPSERPDDLVDIKYHEDGFVFVPKGRIESLTQPHVAGNYLKENLLKPLNTEGQKLSWVLPAASGKEYTALPAFVWCMHEHELHEILAMRGKPNKARTKISSHLELMQGPFDNNIRPDDSFVQAYFTKEKLNDHLNGLDDDIAELLIVLEETVLTLKDHTNYFYFVDGWSSNPVPRKSQLKPILRMVTGLKLKFSLYREDEFVVFKVYLQSPENNRPIEIKPDQMSISNLLVVTGPGAFLGIINTVKEARALQALWYNTTYRVPEKEYKSLLDNIVIPIAREFPVDVKDKSLKMDNQYLKVQQKRIYISELSQFVIFRPVMRYKDDREVNVLEDATLIEREGEKMRHFVRDQEAEQAFLEEVAALHPSFRPKTQQTYFYLSYEDFQKDYWFLKAFEAFKQKGIHVFGFNDLKNLKFYPQRPTVSLGFKSGQDWFETEIDVAFGDNKVSARQLRKAVEQQNAYIELTDGSLGILPEEWMKKFSKLFRSASVEKDDVRVSKTQFSMMEDLVDAELSPEVFEEIARKKERLAHFNGIEEVKTPLMLKAQLRDYQQKGLNWLNFLREYGWGGILADDMGLGKTLQALGLICMELEQNPDQPNLVIAPTTLLFNWKNEIQKFAPELDYFIHHGQRYDRSDELVNHQVVLTSYGIVINDIDLLKNVNFNLIIADESQAIKNLHSKRYKALIRLKGNIRLAMSGTPIENNIYELYAQMNFANPGFFQGFSAFKENYAQAVERNNDPDIIAELRKKTRPFILRRTKEQVLTELPDKTEEYLYCEMNAAQRKVYDAFRNDYRNYLLDKFEEEGLEKSQMYVLEGLTRLRQICDSPQLIEKEGLTEKASAKLDELVRHVTEKTGTHKLLIFSQFVKMLHLIRDRFDHLNTSYEYLDGKTTIKEREKRVAHFQNEPDCRVFLISLKAGGTGLNLTSADYVYIVDPWWNPAVENQAIDRCYRMGQSKKVFAYRMICKDTVEEKIMQLQQQKKALSDDVVGSGEGIMKSLSKADIEELFS